MQSLCIVGGNGNMGKRYQAICRFLGINHFVADPSTKTPIKDASHYLIATPTAMHLENILDIRDKYGGLILCEKPFVTNVDELGRLQEIPANVFMVNNYAFYPGLSDRLDGTTLYSFYNSGPHGLAWDCIQLLHLARSTVKLVGKSPIWKCQINGTKLNRETLDLAYVEMIRTFWQGSTKKLWGKKDIIDAHFKAARFEQQN